MEGNKAIIELTTAQELLDAIKLAQDTFEVPDASLDEYRLVEAKRMFVDTKHCSGARCWRLTFKLARLLPTEAGGILGAGGELFFTVDLDAGEATFTGYGE